MSTNPNMERTAPSLRRQIWRVARFVVYPVIGILSILLLFVALMLVPEARELALHRAIAVANQALPGVIELADAEWPEPGVIELNGVAWRTAESLDVASFDRFRVRIGLAALLKKDVRIEELTLMDAAANLPRMLALFPKDPLDEAAPAPEDEPSGGAGFPRSGSVPSLPSVAIGRLEISVGEFVISDSLAVSDVSLRGAVDLIAGGRPRVSIEEFRAAMSNGTRVDRFALDLDIGEGRLAGEASGWAIPRLPFAFRIDPVGDQRFTLQLDLAEAEHPSENPLLQLESAYLLDQAQLRFDYDAKIETPPIREFLALFSDSVSAGVPDLEGLSLSISGHTEIAEVFATVNDLTFGPNEYIESGSVHASYVGEDLIADSVALHLPGVILEGRAAMRAASTDASVRVEVADARLLQILQPEAAIPESLAVLLDASLMGEKELALEVDLEAGYRSGGLTVDRLTATASTPDLAEQNFDVELQASLMEYLVGLDLTLSVGETIEATTSPIAIVLDPSGLEAEAVARASTLSAIRKNANRFGRSAVHYDAANNLVTAENVRISGVLGEIAAQADLDLESNGEFHVRADWPRMPEPPGLDRFRPGQLDTLKALWSQEGPFHLEVSGKATLDDPVASLVANGLFRLPGPRVLQPVLPDARLDEMEALDGSFAATPLEDSDGFALELDMASEGWLDRVLLHAKQTPDSTRVDSLVVQLPGIVARASGLISPDGQEFDARVSVTETTIAKRFVPSLSDSLTVKLEATATFDSDSLSTRMEASILGSLADSSVVVPSIDIEAAFEHSLGGVGVPLSISIRTPEGVETPDLSIDSLRVDYATFEPDSVALFPGALGIEVMGPQVYLLYEGDIDQDTSDEAPIWEVATDTLTVEFESREVHASRPFEVRYDPNAGSISIDDFELGGRAGSIKIHGTASPDTSDIVVEADLLLPEEPVAFSPPPGLWPERVQLNLEAKGKRDLSANLICTGLTLAHAENVELALDAETSAVGLGITLGLGNEAEQFARGTGSVPMTLQVYPPKVQMEEGELAFDLGVDALPVPVNPKVLDGEFARVDGRFTLSGQAESPLLETDLDVSFPEWDRMVGFRFGFRSRYESESGLRSRVFAMDQSDSLLVGAVSYPISLSLLPFEFEIDETREMQASLGSRTIQLERIAPLLPDNYSAEGSCQISLEAHGAPKDPAFTGSFSANPIAVSLADGTRVSGKAKIDASGTALRPRVEGRVDIASGVIVIPDSPKQLLPVEGEALLWELAADSLVNVRPEDFEGPPAPMAAEDGVFVKPELDITLSVPSGLWIKGQGLEVELSGDLRIVQQETAVITGSLEALRGQFRFLGRVFAVEKGLVQFYGGEELNPALDISLTLDLDGTLLRVAMRGTAKKPELVLSSEPPMSQSDIMSYIVLGKPADQISDDQKGLIQDRATQIAGLMGTAMVEGMVASELGLDIVSVQQGSRPNSGNALVIGKYLNPKVLFKYEQNIDSKNPGGLFNLEYLLSKRLRVGTMFTDDNKSGVELNWSIDY